MIDVMYYYKNNYFVVLVEEDFLFVIVFRVRVLLVYIDIGCLLK